jgi:hypothetical protein
VPTKITKICRVKKNVKSVDLEIQGTGILEEEENCQVFSETFLLLSTASGSSNFTLTRSQVIVPQLPELLTPQDTEVITSHLDQADGTLRALDSIVTRGLSTRQQREISLHELIGRMQEDRQEHNLTTWIVSTIVIILILGTLILTSKYWRQPFLRFASQMFGRRPLRPQSPPQPKRRQPRSPKLPMISEEGTSTEWEPQDEHSLLGCSEDFPLNPCQTRETDPGLARSPRDSKTTDTDAPVSTLGVSYFHPGRFQK